MKDMEKIEGMKTTCEFILRGDFKASRRNDWGPVILDLDAGATMKS